jgi:hypothetical protein
VASAIPTAAARSSFHPSFFFWMAVVMTFFILSGFSLTYWLPMASGSLAPLPPVVHLHGLFYFSWMILLVVQAILINARNVRLHMSVGTFGVALGTGVFLLGGLITILSQGVSNAGPPSPVANTLAYLSVTAVLSFGTLFFLAIRNTRRPDYHKRLILFATINLLPPGVNRLYMVSLGLADVPLLATYLTLDALAVAMLVNDWRTNGRIGAASVTGAAFVLGPQLLYPLVVSSTAFGSVLQVIGDLARYR